MVLVSVLQWKNRVTLLDGRADRDVLYIHPRMELCKQGCVPEQSCDSGWE